MRNLTLTIHFCDISQSFVSATKYENISIRLLNSRTVSVKFFIFLEYTYGDIHFT
jgi:hypothetical protein